MSLWFVLSFILSLARFKQHYEELSWNLQRPKDHCLLFSLTRSLSVFLRAFFRAVSLWFCYFSLLLYSPSPRFTLFSHFIVLSCFSIYTYLFLFVTCTQIPALLFHLPSLSDFFLSLLPSLWKPLLPFRLTFTLPLLFLSLSLSILSNLLLLCLLSIRKPRSCLIEWGAPVPRFTQTGIASSRSWEPI